MSERTNVRYPSRRLFSVFMLGMLSGLPVHGSTISISGSVTGTAAVNFAGRCAPLPTVSATGTGFATGLGNFTDTQSHCTNGPFSFNQGIFDLASTDTPQNLLLGTYTGTSLLQSGLLEFTSTLLVTGGTGSFSNVSGTLLSLGTLDESTGAFSASFSGSVTTVPEPSGFGVLAVGIAAFWICGHLHRSFRTLRAVGARVW
jgi:hypothetical protein